TLAANHGWDEFGEAKGHQADTRPAGGAADQQRRSRIVERAGDDEELAERALVGTCLPLRDERGDDVVVELRRPGRERHGRGRRGTTDGGVTPAEADRAALR